ncbi:MAG: glycosyltransferase [Atribacterota bacterium]|nr:glycosyltransferase [Atribacterota bacterium]
MLSIVIPSKTEVFLKNTVEDVLKKATGEIEIFPVLDGYDLKSDEIIEDERVKYIKLEPTWYCKKRHGINKVIYELAKGKYVMSLDAHCMMDYGFDEVLIKDLEEDWIAIPRRNRLDAKNWCIQKQSDSRPPIDYEYIMYPPKFDPIGFHGFKWDDRTLERWNVKVDDTITMQASCWIMHKSWFEKNGFMQIEGFTGWGMEAEELCFTTWLRGGRVITNKNTWYAHLHKGREYGRMYFLPKKETRGCNAFTFDYFVNNKVPKVIHKFSWLIEKFMPMPGWASDWEKQLYSDKIQDKIKEQLEKPL